ncbi:MAG: hypothetical protein WCD36_00640 [Rhodanobacteraceae bacterium]
MNDREHLRCHKAAACPRSGIDQAPSGQAWPLPLAGSPCATAVFGIKQLVLPILAETWPGLHWPETQPAGLRLPGAACKLMPVRDFIRGF